MEDRLKIRLDLWQLEIFCAVAELKSFSRAAEALFVSQPTVTSHISALEKRLGVKLFDRTTRKVTLTPAGKLLYRHAKALLAEHEAAMQELSKFQGGLRGRLVFGSSTIPAHYLLPSLMAKFCREFPETQLLMRVGSSGEVLDSVLNGELEMGVIGFRPDEPQIRTIPLWNDEVVLIVPPEHEWSERTFVPIAELTNQPFVFREEGSGTRKTFEQFLLKHKISPRQLRIVAEVGSTEAVKQFVAAGGGVGFVSVRAVDCEAEQERLRIVRLQEGRITRQFFAIIPTGRTISPLCNAFVRFLREQV
ncbi:selenium metabolism-associated LysR family transcriptional regulator [Fervidibacter sacchari]|nr:selenium metabolism-associated LysR family transcriptional regulator [Candidatus Fervidibacter sacchari]WKU17991.1 selenium metabolism-associated LysR family transcriptional regulator [Candidatus Fervidibacter sacchari]